MNTLKDLYVHELRDLYNAETQLIDMLQEMANMASHQNLKQSFQEHLEQTRQHKERVAQILDNLGEKPGGEKCRGMEGLIEEARMLQQQDADPDVRDAALITSAQRAEHYEIAGYGTVATYAEILGRREDHDMLGEILAQEKATDDRLKRIAKRTVDLEAAHV